MKMILKNSQNSHKVVYLYIIIALVSILLLSVLVLSCRDKDKGTEIEELAEIPEYKQALITFLCGEVFTLKEDNWELLDIGDYVKEEEIIKVAEGSYCELQFGETAAIRIKENTVAAMETIFLKPQQVNVELKMTAGSILYKIGKLIGDEKFNVKTDSAIVGVRGTKFMVRDTKAQGTLLAVKEGKVVVLPLVINTGKLKEKLKDKVKGKNEQTIKLLEKLEEAAMVVQADQEIIIKKEDLKKTEEAFDLVKDIVNDIIKKLEDEKGAVISFEELEELDNKIEVTIANMQENIGHAEVISKQNKRDLNEVERIRMIKIPLPQVLMDYKAPDAELPDGEDALVSQESLVSVTINVKPDNSDIFLDGYFAGRRNISGLFKDGEKLTFRIKKKGYEEAVKEIIVQEDSDNVHNIVLEKEVSKIVGTWECKEIPTKPVKTTETEETEKPVKPEETVETTDTMETVETVETVEIFNTMYMEFNKDGKYKRWVKDDKGKPLYKEHGNYKFDGNKVTGTYLNSKGEEKENPPFIIQFLTKDIFIVFLGDLGDCTFNRIK